MARLPSNLTHILIALFCLLRLLVLSGVASTLPEGFIETDVGTGWTEPVGIAFDHDPQHANRAYVWERGGKVWVVEDGVRLPAPLIDISEEVCAWRDLGMLGFALHPDFLHNGYVYLFYVVDRHHLLYAGTPNYDPAANDFSAPTIGRITRYTARSSDGFHSVDPASRKVLLGETKSTGVPITNESHGVGSLIFGVDGTLLASCGDGASFELMDDGGDIGNSQATAALALGIISPKENVGAFRSQLIDSHNGKILRMDPETGNGVPSNPFYDVAAPRAPRSRVWALGLRNPYRMTLRPDTGSHDPGAGDPGVIVLGDVGWSNLESVHVVQGAGVNCGWPLFEGLTDNTTYYGSNQVNIDAPNPLGGHFRFRDLIVQDTLDTPSWPNPSDPQQQVPANIPHFMHRRPVIDYGRNYDPIGPVRTGIFDGTTAWQAVIGESNSPVAGPQFQGNCSTGGTFYSAADFPASYQGTYFHADYGMSWIKNIVFGADHRPIEVRNFAGVDTPVFVGTHPITGGLYYVSIISNSVRRIDYAPGGNRPPIASASANVTYGESPLAVTFSSTGSNDPEGTILTYLWTFGDGTTSTEANPMKSFTATGAMRFDATLRVTDAEGGFAEKTVPVFVNHTPPVVEILSPVNGTKYPLDASTTYGLVRRAIAAAGRPTTTRWQVYLHHDDHEHPEPPVDAPESNATISPIHSDTSTFYYRVVCTVTDDLGASTQVVSLIVPNETNVAPQIAWSSATQTRAGAAGSLLLDANATASDADSAGLEFGRLQVGSSAAGDTFSIQPEGDGSGQINVAESSVRYGGVSVGTLSGGVSGQPLIVTFASTATPEIAQAVLRRVALQCSGDGTHEITATLADGDGGVSASAVLAVHIANQPPTVSVTGPANGSVVTAPAAVALTATASDPDGIVAKVEFFSGATKVGEDSEAPFSFAWSGIPAGEYTVTARATDDLGATTQSDSVTFTVQPDTVLPAQWATRDIGSAAIPGSTEFADGVYTISSAGAGYSTTDQFHFLMQPWTGDGEIIARVVSVDSANPHAFAGVMVRENRSATGRHALLGVNPNAAVAFQWRAQPSVQVRQKGVASGASPQWLRLVRHGARCTAYVSVDGTQWEQAWSVALLLPAKVFVGLAVSSGVADGTSATAVFDQVIVRSLPAAPQSPLVQITNPANAASFVAPAPITIDMNATDSDGGIARVDLIRDGSKIASDTKAPFSFAWTGATPGIYTLTARAVDFTGLKATSLPITISVQPVPTTLPVPWANRDIGNAEVPGAADYADGSFTLTGSGDDLLYTTDQAHFVWQSWTGDGTLIARIASIAPTHPTSLGGLVFRENFAANGRYVAATLSKGQGASLQFRSGPGVNSAAGSARAVAVPQWLRLIRRGNRFSAAASADGVTWQTLGSQTMVMSQTCKVGLIMCAGAGGEPTTVVFDSVSVTP